jgi:hypothetical protein
VRGLPVEAQSADGVEVDAYPVSAVDLVDGPVTLTCSPAAPHGFRLGETGVDRTASDGAGNKATASFNPIPPMTCFQRGILACKGRLGLRRAV